MENKREFYLLIEYQDLLRSLQFVIKDVQAQRQIQEPTFSFFFKKQIYYQLRDYVLEANFEKYVVKSASKIQEFLLYRSSLDKSTKWNFLDRLWDILIYKFNFVQDDLYHNQNSDAYDISFEFVKYIIILVQLI
ncbi:unnamed protein product (macronuclear) [Paramecium tetraurelia]|uniref:Uncharacterized protein n=1 Tax=Paramecium tetraurelia TaxID=5888 RepID=A0DHW1_PARTE|nr:uncharacterized protein GSPATT00039504001 [Paramecium tetraurelia]CAK82628.1 unnamed protein product [Paramecium tetraurelia]|eukprot:XP_001450025.1 hypothetical protein (macronuclear) [Paramecium tetraurelia strain d4-2]